MKTITIDCSGITDPKALHRMLARGLDFPQWYGHNLDALYDCLTDIREPVFVRLLDWHTAESRLGSYGQTVRRVWEDAAEENPHITAEFV